MVTRQRHTQSEIIAKLAMADEMAVQGMLHRDIAKSLGVSLMTYHRWRKARGPVAHSTSRFTTDAERAEISFDHEKTSRIRELQVENLRLRRLVADLLLEKVELAERLRGSSVNRRMVERN